jgi:hypothetical protein
VLGSQIDRYVPPGGPGGPAISTLPDPHKLDYSVTYTYFSDWYHQEHSKERERESITKDEVQSAYDKYKDELNGRLAKLFVTAHKNDEWFKERYMPGEREVTKAKIVEFRQGQWQKWKAQLDSGSFDDVDRESQIPSGIRIENGGADDVVEDVNRGVDDGGLKPVLLIKTISPTVSRVQLEEVRPGPRCCDVVANTHTARCKQSSGFPLCLSFRPQPLEEVPPHWFHPSQTARCK